MPRIFGAFGAGCVTASCMRRCFSRQGNLLRIPVFGASRGSRCVLGALDVVVVIGCGYFTVDVRWRYLTSSLSSLCLFMHVFSLKDEEQGVTAGSASARRRRESTHRCKLSLIILAVYSNHRLVVHNSELLSSLLAAADTEQTPHRKAAKPNDAASTSASSKVWVQVQSLTASNTNKQTLN